MIDIESLREKARRYRAEGREDLANLYDAMLVDLEPVAVEVEETADVETEDGAFDVC